MTTPTARPLDDSLDDPCEYSPEHKRAAYTTEVHARADVIVGHNGKWRLCRPCAALPEFSRFRVRHEIHAVKKTRPGVVDLYGCAKGPPA